MKPINRSLVAAALAAGAAVLAGCSGSRQADAAERPHARFVHAIDGFYGPESVKYDPDQDVWFVTAMLGYGSAQDGQAYVVRVPGGSLGPPAIFIQSGRNGAVLNAPKGMAIHGDTLWMADIDALRGFDRRTGAPLATVDFRPQRAVMLNDVTVGRDGLLYVTDSGIQMTEKGVLHPGGDRIFVVGPNHAVGVVAGGAALARPNGIIPAPGGGNALAVVSFDPFRSQVYTIQPGDPQHRVTVVARGKGKFDGVEALADGRFLVSCWNDSSIHVLSNGRDEKIIGGLSQPADIGVDTRRNRIAIPQVIRGRVEFWELPR